MYAMNFKTKGAYKKRYTIRSLGSDGLNRVVSLPPEVIDRKAEEAGLSTEDFIKHYRAVAHYDNFDGVYYTFEKVNNAEPNH